MYKLAVVGALASLTAFGVSKKVTLDDLKSLHNSCTNLPDGEHYLKLLDGDDYPIVKALCSNGYTMIDYSIDNDWDQYFSSFLKWHMEIAGPSQTDHVNWKEWYLPESSISDSNEIGNYLISPDCSSCSEDLQSSLRNSNEFQSGYYMNANLFGCFVYPRGMPDCDFDLYTYECHSCYTEVNFATIRQTDWDDEDTTDMGACMTWIRGANDLVDTTFDDCTAQTENGWKPTMGTKGRFCVCTKPDESNLKEFAITQDMINKKQESLASQLSEQTALQQTEEKLSQMTSDDNTVHLYARDFEAGTYRIQTPGTYIIMEDIEFDFNAGDMEDPNSEEAWWPNENDDDYPGFGKTREAYFMGYFAGITIECDDVTLNLNGHELKQSKPFFYQQGFFSTVEVENQPFIPGQGVGFFGSDPVFPANVVIKNGNLGRTSHHCVHGNYNKNLLIENVNCYDFSTHGIQLNGFDGVTLKNVDIGPANTEQYLASEYTHYRFILPRMRKMAQENPDGTISFVSRDKPVTMGDLVEELERKMTLAFKYVMLDEKYKPGDHEYEDFIDAKKIFVNDNGLGYGGSQYGLFLSYPGANVLSYHINSKVSNDVTIENVRIHDLKHQTKEYSGIRTDLRLFVNSFNAPLHVQYLLGDEMWNDFTSDGRVHNMQPSYKYKGNILTDSTIAMSQLSTNWGYLQIMYLLSDELTAWATDPEQQNIMFDKQGIFLCGVDGMIHSAKGTFGLRIDGVNNVNIDGLTVENIEEHSPLGYTLCGQCDKCAFESRFPYQHGYAGNAVQAISVDYATPITMKDVTVNNIHSKTGSSFGVSLWPGSEVTFEGDINIHNVRAGSEVNIGQFTYEDRPNMAPEACGIRVYNEDAVEEDDDDKDVTTVTFADNVNMKTQCVDGHATCFNLEGIRSMHGDLFGCDGTMLMSQSEREFDEKQINQLYQVKDVQETDNNNHFAAQVSVNENRKHISYLWVYGIFAFAVLFAIMYCNYKCTSKTKKQIDGSEYTPLIS